MPDRTFDDNDEPKAELPRVKEPYEAPELFPWGSMRDITLNVGVSGATDGAMKSPNKTH